VIKDFPGKGTNLRSRFDAWLSYWRISRLARQVAAHAQTKPGAGPVVFFNASTRLTGLSQNAAFSQLTSWSLRLAGVPVKYFVCQAGMSACILGTNREDYRSSPPCTSCLHQSRRLYSGADVFWFQYKPDASLVATLQSLTVDQLSDFETPSNFLTTGSRLANSNPPLPLGRIALPSIRWALRRHTLPDDEDTRYLFREYLLSAHNVAREFTAFLDQARPSTAVIFNGIMYPEATARWVAQQKGVRVITHEVGFLHYSAFFTEGQATAYPIHIPEEFKLSPDQNAQLDAYLENRFQGKFTMAGIRFWPEMRGLDETFLSKAAQFRQMVSIFTNVVYDTSQVHANQVFSNMFVWLDLLLKVIRGHPETLFVIRAHPDEMRPGTAKQSRESVQAWVKKNGVDVLPNVVFIDSQEYTSSYELIQRAKFVIVYNSSIGLEAALMGAAVLCGGQARYTQYPIVFFPDSPQAYQELAETFLQAEKIEVPPEFQLNARRFLYYQLFRASLSFEDYLQEGHRKGLVTLKPFSWQALLPAKSETLRILLDGIAGEAPVSLHEVARTNPTGTQLDSAKRDPFLLEETT